MRYLQTTSGTVMVDIIGAHIHKLCSLGMSIREEEIDPEFYIVNKPTHTKIVGLLLMHEAEDTGRFPDLDWFSERNPRGAINALGKALACEVSKDENKADLFIEMGSLALSYYNEKSIKDIIDEVIDYMRETSYDDGRADEAS